MGVPVDEVEAPRYEKDINGNWYLGANGNENSLSLVYGCIDSSHNRMPHLTLIYHRIP